MGNKRTELNALAISGKEEDESFFVDVEVAEGTEKTKEEKARKA